MTYLSVINHHPRDDLIVFDEGPHVYTVKGENNYTSVTTWNHSHFKQFDADKVIKQMMSSRRWYQNKYFNKSPEEIKAIWEANRDDAAKAGTKMHYDIECYYNNMPVDNSSVEFNYFMNFVREHPELKPYRTEWMVWDEELRLAGSIDMVFENKDGTLMIYDWKRSREIIRNKQYEEYSITECISHLPDTNFWHYSLQLNTYKAILEKNYGKKVTALRLVCLHPSNKNKNYIIIDVPDLQEEVDELFALRKDSIN
jgi:ATP-dependent exoDNAse (exonuclease V) beta subunit